MEGMVGRPQEVLILLWNASLTSAFDVGESGNKFFCSCFGQQQKRNTKLINIRDIRNIQCKEFISSKS